jgi:hypothetical protein
MNLLLVKCSQQGEVRVLQDSGDEKEDTISYLHNSKQALATGVSAHSKNDDKE